MGKKKNYLKVGDIIELKPGHEVYAMVEARSVYANRKYSRKLTQTNVTTRTCAGKGRTCRHKAHFAQSEESPRQRIK